MNDPREQKVQRSRTCRLCPLRQCCDGSRVRVMLKAPTPDDPEYEVAVCPHCDELVLRA